MMDQPTKGISMIPARNIYANPHEGEEVASRLERAVAGLLVLLIAAYTAFALIQGVIIGFSMNRVIGIAVVFTLIVDFVFHLTGPRVVAACLVCTVAAIGMGMLTTNLSEEIEFWVYWGCTLLLLSYISRPRALGQLYGACVRCRKLLAAITLIGSLLIFGLIVTHTGYVGGWGGSYFAGLCNTKHTMASVCCLVLAAALLCWRMGVIPRWLLFASGAVVTFALLQTGARTYLVPALVIWLFMVNRTIEQRWIRVAVIAALSIVALVAFASSGMAEKFEYLDGLDDASGSSSFSSGRVDYWSTDLAAFAESGLFSQLIGNSASFVYDLNQRTFFMRIWSHDDFVMVLCAAGVVGLCTYLATLCLFFSRVREKTSGGGVLLVGRLHPVPGNHQWVLYFAGLALQRGPALLRHWERCCWGGFHAGTVGPLICAPFSSAFLTQASWVVRHD